MQTVLDQLNEQQRYAVTQTDGPMLVLAGAGSGKTRTITYKIAYLIATEACSPEEILAVTFTNKAAEEMRGRVDALAGGLSTPPLMSTFHSFGVRVLRRYADRIGHRRDFVICDTDDQLRLIKEIYRESGLRNEDIPIRQARAAISHAKNRGLTPATFADGYGGSDAKTIAQVFWSYERALRRSNGMDFDDLIGVTVDLLSEHRDLRERYGRTYRYLLIDEYQDTNAPQYELVKSLTAVHHNVTAVGDEDQSIYAFRGADISNILRFEKDFPNAVVVKLEQNYRSTQPILDAATALISNNVSRKGKELWTDQEAGALIQVCAATDARDEAYLVGQRIYEHLARNDGKIAVLYRTNFQSRQFEEALGRMGISYRLVGGLSFYQRKEIRDALAYLRVASRPEEDLSLLRIVNTPRRGIGARTIEELLEVRRKQEGSLWQALQHSLEEQRFGARAHQALAGFAETVRDCRAQLELPLHLAIEQILEISGYVAALKEEDTEEAANRLLNLNELISSATDYGDEDDALQAFLDHAALRTDADDFDETAKVTLATLHNSKGLEFAIVFIVGCEEGLFPHSRSLELDALEEERRLCYVGLTRAQQRLYLTYSLRRRFFGRERSEPNKPSRFLTEIPAQLKDELSSDLAGRSRGLFAPVSVGGSSLSRPRGQRRKYSGRTYDSVGSVQQFLAKKGRGGGITAGIVVEHADFGRGKVLSVEQTSNDLKITVQFPGRGITKLVQSHAKLKPV